MSRTKHHGDKRKEALFGDNWQWMAGCPKWFSTMTKHKPQRAHERLCKRAVLLGDDPNWPHDKKPVEYWW